MENTAAQLRDRLANPRDIFTLLLIVGGDVIHKALAQVSGGWITPVTFSFGWVAFGVNSLLLAMGERRIMPQPDCNAIVVPAGSGYTRSNASWVISRIFRDFEHWKDPRADTAEQQRLKELRADAIKDGKDPEKVRIALRLIVYRVIPPRTKSFIQSVDLLWWSGIVVFLAQVAISVVPFALYRDWLPFFTTMLGTGLALVTGLLPQWKYEKLLSCRQNAHKIVTITEGNGASEGIVIDSNGIGPDLEDLAAGRADASVSTRIALGCFALFWFVLLACVAGYSQHPWFMLGLGGLGMVHNMLVAGLPRRPEHYGVNLEYVENITDGKVMEVLATAEKKYPGLGSSLVNIFFPGKLWPREKDWWAYADRRYNAYKADLKSSKTLGAVKIHTLPELRGKDPIPADKFL